MKDVSAKILISDIFLDESIYPRENIDHKRIGIFIENLRDGVKVQPYVTKLQWLTAETQRTQREDNFSFAVERTAKENCSAALLHNNLTLMHYYSLPYHCEVLQNAQKGWFLLFSVLSTESNKKTTSASSAS